MPIAVVCPSCDSRLNAPDAAAGKTVKCPKCKVPMVIPTPEADPGFEAVDDPAPAPKLAAVKTDVMLDDDDDEVVEEKPRAKKPAREVEEDEDRPKKKGKGKHKKKVAAGTSPGLLIGAIVGCVLLIGGGLFVMYWFGIREKPKETASNSTSTPTAPQPGGPGTVPPITGGPEPTPPVQPSGPVKPLYESSNAVSRAQSNNNLKQIGLAFHNFDSTNGALPAGYCDSTGKVGLSWRVAILPYLEQDSLYRQFKLNEPWDSESNKKLIPMMPKIYAAPGKEPNDGLTYYRSFTGPETAFPSQSGQPGKPALGLKLSGFADGTSNTGLVVEAGDPVIWTRPDELVFNSKDPPPRVGGIFGNGFHVVFADGSTRFLKANLSPETLKAIITVKGGEVIDFEK